MGWKMVPWQGGTQLLDVMPWGHLVAVVLGLIKRARRGSYRGLKQKVQWAPFYEQKRAGPARGVKEREGWLRSLIQG